MRFALVTLLAVALAACGASQPEQRAPRAQSKASLRSPLAAADPERLAIMAVLAGYERAIRAGDAETICARLLSGGDCERDLIADAIAGGGPRYRLIVTSIAVRGDRATARTRATGRDGTQDRSQPLVRERGRWLLTTPRA